MVKLTSHCEQYGTLLIEISDMRLPLCRWMWLVQDRAPGEIGGHLQEWKWDTQWSVLIERKCHFHECLLVETCDYAGRNMMKTQSVVARHHICTFTVHVYGWVSERGVCAAHSFMREMCTYAFLSEECICCSSYKVTYPYTFTVGWLTLGFHLHISWWCSSAVGGGRVAVHSWELHVWWGKINGHIEMTQISVSYRSSLEQFTSNLHLTQTNLHAQCSLTLQVAMVINRNASKLIII